ncbi:MAG: VWA domain-containing protein [Acidobacteriota bacterium]
MRPAWKSAALSASIALAASIAVPAGQERQPEQRIAVQTVQVLVDVVVTDQKGRFVGDLKLEDFELFEDGVPHQLASAMLAAGAPSRPTPGGPGREASSAQMNLPAAGESLAYGVLLFDTHSLSFEGRHYATRAALQFVEGLGRSDRFAVFGSDRRLFLVQSFTSDKEALRAGVESAIASTSAKNTTIGHAIQGILFNTSFQVIDETVLVLRPEEALAQALNPFPDPLTSLGNSDTLLLRAFLTFQGPEEDAQAVASIRSLLSVIRGLKGLPGRKSLILVSEGFTLPGSRAAQFRSAVSAANRANVAIYTLDAAGLRFNSESEETELWGGASLLARRNSVDPTWVVNGESRLGRSERTSRGNRQSILVELAESTGGLAIRKTNDLLAGFRRIRQDMRSHYLLSYSPLNLDFDGSYRKIEVRVRPPGLRVRARDGYFGARTADESLLPVLEFEQRLYRLALSREPPRDLKVSAAALHFPAQGGGERITLAVAVPTRQISLSGGAGAEARKPPEEAQEASKGRPRLLYKGRIFSQRRIGELELVALVMDSSGLVLRKVSKKYPVDFSARRLQEAIDRDSILMAEIDLAPGEYELAVAVRDAKSGQAGVSRIPLSVAEAGSPGLRLSQIIPSRGSQAVGGQSVRNSLRLNQEIVTPNLKGTFSSSSDPAMMFFFAVQAQPGAGLEAKLQLWRQGRLAAELAAPMPPADQAGGSRTLMAFPMGPAFPPGRYQARVTVVSGGLTAVREAAFSIVD